MTRISQVGALVLIALLAATLVGCGKVKEAVSTGAEVARVAKDAQDGEFDIKGKDGEEIHIDATDADGEGGTMTMTGPDGTETVMTTDGEDGVEIVTTDEKGETTTSTWASGDDVVTEESIGIKFYPGADVEAGGSMTSTGGAGGYMGVTLTTPDAFEKVAKFYKDEYTGVQTTEMGQMLMLTVGEGRGAAQVVVAREEDKDITTIAIMKGEM